jgi:hypothetical protein
MLKLRHHAEGGAQEALTTDRNFEQAGFARLLKP